MEELANKLSVSLATVFTFYLTVHKYHWNVEDNQFPEFHKFFNDIYDDVWESVDKYAERIRTLGKYAPGSYEEFFALSEIECDKINDKVPLKEMLAKLQADNDTVLRVLTDTFSEAQKTNQQGIANFLADRIDVHEKWKWMIKASLGA